VTYCCVIMGAILLTCIAVFAVGVYTAATLRCPICKSEAIDDYDTHHECQNCGHRFS
jgi:hypothetical protein